MTANIAPFTHSLFGTIRTMTGDNGEPLFVATDIAKVLGYRDAANMARRLDEDEKGTRSTSTPGGAQSVTVITEAGLYSAILGSKRPDARQFKRWVTHEVLPAIRRHGGYLTPAKVEEALLNPDTLIRLATDLKAERERRAALEAQAEADRPKVLFADAVTASKSTCLVGELAKILRGNGIQIGQNRLFAWMRERGYLINRRGSDRNMPTQRSMELGLFEIKETAITHSDGHVTISRTPKVTGKGQTYFVEVLLKESKEAA